MKCECGENKKCVRVIKSNYAGRMWIENKSHFKCGKVKQLITKIKKSKLYKSLMQ